jgi:hypothetical protein
MKCSLLYSTWGHARAAAARVSHDASFLVTRRGARRAAPPTSDSPRPSRAARPPQSGPVRAGAVRPPAGGVPPASIPRARARRCRA